jgi:hypothetical protein
MSNRRAVISRHEKRPGSEGGKIIPGESDCGAAERSGDKVIIQPETLAQQATMRERSDRHEVIL